MTETRTTSPETPAFRFFAVSGLVLVSDFEFRISDFAGHETGG
jgi:hypothetical protein